MAERPVNNRRNGWRVPVMWAVAALAAAVLPVPPAAVERLYSAAFYRAFQPRVTALSNQLPFSLLDAALAVAAAMWAALAARDVMRLHSARRAARFAVARTIIWAAAAYLVFLIAWGFNYRRVRLVDALPFDPSRVSAAAVRSAAAVAVERLNALYEPGRADEAGTAARPDPSLTEAMHRALADVGRGHRLVAGRPKWTILDPYFRRAGVDGMTDPFFLETLISSDVLPFERPFVVAHEWAHLAGVADEGEANFVAWLACLRAPPAARYSGWLFLYRELAQTIPAEARTAIAGALAAGPRADLRAIRERIAAHVDPRVAAVGWSVYDSYLKANRVEAGAASYGEVVRLVLGARLPSGWEPLAR
jgi:hypothetical protein